MKRNKFWPMILMACFLAPVASAKDYGAELIQSCAAIQLKSCKMTDRKVSFNQLSTYSKAFNCLKNGSTSGDRFNLGIPLPDAGQLGINFGSTATYSTQVCREEISKMDSANFLKAYSETFDKECGRTLAGQYEQCVAAARSLSEPLQVQSLKCNAVQSSEQVTINTRYVPGAMEGPAQYKIASISGLDGIRCDADAYPGVNQYSSISCALPKDYRSAQLVVKLANTVSCTVPISIESKLEIGIVRKVSCAALYGAIDDLNEMPFMLKTVLVGQCDICLAENLSTPETDQRNLRTRAIGCAVWAAKKLGESKMQFCTVRESNQPAGVFPASSFGYTGAPGLGGPGTSLPPPTMPTAPGTERIVWGAVGANSQSLEGQKEIGWASALCNGRKIGEITQIRSDAFKPVPIDYLNTSEAQDPAIRELVKKIEKFIAKD